MASYSLKFPKKLLIALIAVATISGLFLPLQRASSEDTPRQTDAQQAGQQQQNPQQAGQPQKTEAQKTDPQKQDSATKKPEPPTTGSTVVNFLFSGAAKLISSGMSVLVSLFGVLLSIAGQLLDFTLTEPSLQKFTSAGIVREGWTITRDLANMLFSLILIVISFATILKIDEYGVKALLPKIIGVALLINFSLLFAGLIIDFSQVMTKYFVDASTGQGGKVSYELMNGLKLQTNFAPENLGNISWKQGLDGLTSVIIANFMNVIVILIAAFTFFAGAIFMLVRMVALWFLLIMAPLVWLASILPNTRKYWNEWWQSFVKWVVFAPAYTFLLYLAITIIKSGEVLKNVGFNEQHINSLAADKTSFGAQMLGTFVNYVIIIGFLIGSLIVAQRSGVAGAGMAMGAVKRGQRWVSGKAGRLAMRPVAAGYGAVGGRFAAGGATALKHLGFKKWGGRLEAKSKMIKETSEKLPQNQAYKANLARQSNTDVLNEAEHARGIRKKMAAEEALRRGLNKTATPEQVKTMANTLRAFGQTEQAEKLTEVRPDAIETVDKNGNKDLSDLEKTIAKTIREGNLNLISHLAVENADVAATVAKLSTPKQIEDLANRSEQHKESLKKGLETASTQNPDDEKIQFAYASRHGDPRRLTEKQKVEWAQKVGVGGMKELAFFDATVANSIPPNKLIKLIEEMKGPMANEYIKHIKQNKSAAGHELAMSHAYLSKLGGETTKRAPFTTV